MYSYRKSVKSDVSDELINTYLLRPVAGLVVRALYDTPVTPNQVTMVSTVAGVIAGAMYLQGSSLSVAAAGLLVTLKDMLDSADGQLARARNQYSRLGRFLDSIGDFVVDVAVFGAIGWLLVTNTGNPWWGIAALFGLVGISLRVSYHVYYQTNFLHQERTYQNNRLSEEIRPEDRTAGVLTLTLQRTFQLIYGWQDRSMAAIDRWSMGLGSVDGNPARRRVWYSDTTALRISGFLGFGTELFVLMLCSVFNELKLYLILNLVLMNGIWFFCIFYRRAVVSKRILCIN